MIQRRSSIVTPAGGLPGSRQCPCWSDRSEPGRARGVDGHPPRDEGSLWPGMICFLVSSGFTPSPSKSTCRWRRSTAWPGAGRDPGELLAAWQAKTNADREQFWKTLEPGADDNLLREVVKLAVRRGPPDEVALSLSNLGESIIPVIAQPWIRRPTGRASCLSATLVRGSGRSAGSP